MATFGSNVGFVDEMYAKYKADPEAVGEAWREFFADYQPQRPSDEGASAGVRAGDVVGAGDGHRAIAARAPASERARVAVASEASREAPPHAQAPAAERARPSLPAASEGVVAKPLSGIGQRIAENMAASVSVPTATSTRTLPVKLLEENRRIINQHQDVVARKKVSFTDLIAWAVVRATERHPAMNAGYAEEGGVAYRLERRAVNLGLAIDVERKGERLLLVPNIKDAASLGFQQFITAYDDIITKARQNKLAVEDFQNTTVTLTNPGMIGTSMSVPRLMAGQGTIVGAGKIGYPAEYAGMAPEVISHLGLSKVMTVTSTYDHRVIQGAESGSFLATIERLLLGEEEFYDRIFRELGIATEPTRWAGDQNPPAFAEAGSLATEAVEKQAMVLQLIRAYRVRGHLSADLDPLHVQPVPRPPELELSTYGLSVWDLDRRFITGGLAGEKGTLPLRDILEILRQTYCCHMGVEFMHIPEGETRAWLQERVERTRNSEPLSPAMKQRILTKLNAAEAFERFLHATYVGHKRFSLEGAETLIPMLDALLNEAAAGGARAAIIGMAHRGRLNVLANIVGKSYGNVFREFEDVDPASTHGSGDVKYHLGASGVHVAASGARVAVDLASNPSHLEAVDPVVEGMAHALQNRLGDNERRQVLPILVHGDAAFAGQGVVAETLNLSDLAGYSSGGTVHIVINNRIGFTTDPKSARSSLYATDIAKAVRAPILHVNGDRPEDAVRAVLLALAFRDKLKLDAVVDLVCYRRWGHNEADEPSFTNPVMYAAIERHRSVRKIYTEYLLRRGDIDGAQAERALGEFQQMLASAHEEVRRAAIAGPTTATSPTSPTSTSSATAASGLAAASGVAASGVTALPSSVAPGDAAARHDGSERGNGVAARVARPSTGVELARLREVLEALDRVPPGFTVHPKLAKQLPRRRERFAADAIDWGVAEALAFGSLVLEGTPVRLSGQDSGRGTFSQRHAKLYDYRTGAVYTPLAHLSPEQASFVVCDSQLSEFAVLGFEYGYSAKYPEALVLWEAQFGDFANGAQVIIDQFMAGAEEKWGQKSALTLLLPHGFEGQGPEHSSARIERFLQLAAHDNLRIVHPSTPASYFHLLRLQAKSPPKPLVVFTPKSLLRLPECTSTAAELAHGSFAEVLDDTSVSNGRPMARLLLTSGKIYYELAAHRRERQRNDVAIVRLEQLYPFPGARLTELLQGKYAETRDIVWVQEEPRNMGAYGFIRDAVPACLNREQTLRYVGRDAAASPATGSLKRHLAEQRALVAAAFTQSTGREMAAMSANEAAVARDHTS